MQFKHLCLDSSAALHNACLLKINRHLAVNLKASQAPKLGTLHANLKPQRSWYQCTTYAHLHLEPSSRDKGPEMQGVLFEQKSCSYTFSSAFLLTMWILHARLRYGQRNTLRLPSLPLHPAGIFCNVFYRATSGNVGPNPLHLKEVSNPDHALLGPGP